MPARCSTACAPAAARWAARLRARARRPPRQTPLARWPGRLPSWTSCPWARPPWTTSSPPGGSCQRCGLRPYKLHKTVDVRAVVQRLTPANGGQHPSQVYVSFQESSLVHVSACWLTLTCGMTVQGVQQSKLATAFGPEHAEDEREDASGMSARVQIGDALVALLDSHRSHRSALLSGLFHDTLPASCASSDCLCTVFPHMSWSLAQCMLCTLWCIGIMMLMQEAPS